MMAFFHQLRLLLWKNYTLKKRSPYIMCLELIVPLVLFLILVAIRNHQKPKKSGVEYWGPDPLPSAGIVPLLQSFCKNNVTTESGYRVYPNSSFTKVLTDVVEISQTPVFNAVIDLRQLLSDFEKFSDEKSLLNSSRNIQNVKLSDIFSKTDALDRFLRKNLSMPQNLVNDLLNATFNGSEISHVLLERNSHLFEDFVHDIEQNGIPSSQQAKKLQQYVALQALFDPTALYSGPTWIRILGLAGNVPGIAANKTNWEELKVFIESRYLSPKEIKLVSCNAKIFSSLIILQNQSSQDRNALQKFLCNLNGTQAMAFSNELKYAFNWTSVRKKFHVQGPIMVEYNERAEKIRKDLMKLSNLKEAYEKLAQLAADLQLNLTTIDNRRNESRPHQIKENANDMWNVLIPVLCGKRKPKPSDDNTGKKADKNTFQELFEGKGEPLKALKFMLYTLTNDPMILYSPNGTDADKVMEKSGHFLKVLKTTKEMAIQWLKLSAKFRKIVQQNDTQDELKELIFSVDQFPFMFDEYSNESFVDTPQHLKDYILQHNTTLNVSKLHLKTVIRAFIIDSKGNSLVLEYFSSIDHMAKGWIAVLRPMKLDIFYGFPNETALLNFISNVTAPTRRTKTPILSAVVFDNIGKDGKLPKHIFYRIRMNGQYLPTTHEVQSPYWTPGPAAGKARYFYFGFAWMQDQLERAMIEVLTGKNVSAPGIYTQELPYPCYLHDNFIFVIQYIMPLCVVASFIYSVALLVQSIVYEKEQRLKEVMKMMGLSNAVHWTAWFITSAVTMMMIVILLTIILKIGGILKHSNPIIILLFLTLAAIATTNFCFLISIFFSKAKLAAACGGIIYFVTYMPYVFISVQEGSSTHMKIKAEYKSLASLLSTTAFGLGARYFALLEQDGTGVQWSNIATSPLENDHFNLAEVFKMLIADTFIYAILVWYIEAVHPGTYGIRRPWYFPFQLSYWLGPMSNQNCEMDCFKAYERVTRSNSEFYEVPNTPALLAVEGEPIHLKLGVVIDNLVKIYKKGSPPAVDHLSLNLYEGQITSFLGHNGAGKTTTMSLLTGLFSSTSGTAYIYGNDIHKDMDKIRRSLGLCPQHNILYNQMTVEEHLWFYARLKGMPEKQVREETNRILEDIGLPEKHNSLVETLSGGMKRKLSVAMAFVGGSKTVILDEPTAGVDPFARRAIWELLAKYKDGRTILLSTHFMDEADILGDRIAIISHGKLRCCGSSLFLKTKFGDGYHLTVLKQKSADPDKKVFTELITKFIQDYVPSAQLICQSQYELSYILPDKGKERKGVLKELFDSLERNKERLQCKGFGLQDTTLEEVFLKVTEATVAGEEDMDNELTVPVNLPLSTPAPPSNEIELENVSSPESIVSTVSTIASLSSPTDNHLLIAKPGKGHKRSFSTDFVDNNLTTVRKQQVPVCAHRRTASGGFSGHHRALSSDLTFALNREDANTPDTVKKVSKHKRVPSGVAKMQTVGNEAWELHAGGTTQNKNAWQQFYGLLIKRYHHSRKNLKALLTHILLPGIFISIAMTVALAQPNGGTSPPLVLSPTMFHPPPYYIPFSNSKESTSDLSARMENSLTLPSGIGSDCVLKNKSQTTGSYSPKELRKHLSTMFDPFCMKQVGEQHDLQKLINLEKRYNISKYDNVTHVPTCKCVYPTMEWLCEKGTGENVEFINTVTLDTLVNVTHEKMKSYLVNTNFLQKRHRYGALTFGDERKVVPKVLQQSPHVEIQKLFLRDTVRVWFSNNGFHSMPTFINAMDNAILRASVTPEMGNPAAYGITATTHPLNFAKNALNIDAIKQGTDAIIAIFVIIAMSFVPASFVVFLVMERTTKAKHIQFVSGVNPVLYWLSNYLWDMLHFMVPAMACMVIFHVFDVPAYASRSNFPAVCALFICYGWSITPMMYPASFIFKEASTAYVVLILLNLFLGITCTVTTSILQLFPHDDQLKFAFEVVRLGSLVFPNYCLGRGLMDLAYNEVLNTIYREVGQFDEVRSPFEWDIVLRSLVCMISEGFIFFIITLIIEYRSSIKRQSVTVMDSSVDGDDIDVADERLRVLSGGADDDLLRVENLTKVYNSKKTGKHMAVNRLTLGVSKGECFGLLGVNGAGKTTTFKMLTGDLSITAGDAFVENNSVVRNLFQVHQKIGYCPQFDALIDQLTAEEHLYFYARMKGIPELEIKGVCNWLIKKMALTRYAKKPSGTYSGGNKRKLSAAIALIGNPSVIFMDEPTTGMDPGARRFLWNVILSIIQQGNRSVVLTSHSMEECEALCTRLAIMVNGQFQCLGSTQHIKDRYGDGYIVVVRIKGSLPDMGAITNFMLETFHHSVLKECHHNVAQFQIPSSDKLSLADIFSKMEVACKELEIEDYSVSQTSLDNVFVNFAKHQTDTTLHNDPSFIHANSESKLKNLKSKWRRLKSAIKTKKRSTTFTHLVPMPSGDCEELGSIGEDEDEVSLDGADSFSFPIETTRLTFDA